MQADVTVVSQREVIPFHYELVFFHRELAECAQPGQFVHIHCGQQYAPLLRRPISIHAIDRQRGEITLLYRVVGEGTKLLAAVKPGDRLNLLGPLGHGFTWPDEAKKVLFIGGGIGVAPLYAAAVAAIQAGKEVIFLLGAAKRDVLLSKEKLQALDLTLHVCTDDGSEGFHGHTVQLLQEVLKKERVDYIGACGPMVMLKAVAAATPDIVCQVSLEEKMACGIGACLGCVCTVVEQGQEFYSKVCSVGPVFDAKKVKWHG